MKKHLCTLSMDGKATPVLSLPWTSLSSVLPFLRLLPTFALFSSNKFLPTVFLSNSTFLIDFPAMRLMVTIPPSLPRSVSLIHLLSTCFISVPLSHLISTGNTLSSWGHHSLDVCVMTTHSRRECVWEEEMSFPIWSHFFVWAPLSVCAGEKNQMEMQSQSVKGPDEEGHTHAHAHNTCTNILSSPLPQGSHAENCFGHGDEERGSRCGDGVGWGLFNLHF